MRIKILSTGGPNCVAFEKLVTTTLAEMKIKASILLEEDIPKILAYGIKRTPCLIINDEIVWSGGVPTLDELKTIIETHKDKTSSKAYIH